MLKYFLLQTHLQQLSLVQSLLFCLKSKTWPIIEIILLINQKSSFILLSCSPTKLPNKLFLFQLKHWFAQFLVQSILCQYQIQDFDYYPIFNQRLYFYIVMNLELNQPHFQGQEHLNYLLDYSDILWNQSVNHSYDFSISKDKLNISEKERTRQQSYEDICKQINQAKLEQVQLNQQLQRLKQDTYKNYLGPFRSEFQQLNQENVALRAELNQYRRKTKEDKSQRLSNRSSVKPRTSMNSVYGDQNAKTHTKAGRKYASPNIILKKKQIKITESSTNLGRSQIVSPRLHRRRQSQLTERRMQQNTSIGVSMNASYYDEKNDPNFRASVSKSYLKQQSISKNIFVELLQKMLIEQRIRDNHKYSQLYLQVNEKKSFQKAKEEVIFINELEEEMQTTNDKLQMLTLVMNKYQSQIQGMDINIKNVSQIFQKLYSVKGRFVEMQKKCGGLVKLRKEVNQRQQFLNKNKDLLVNQTTQASNKNISSVQTMIKIITNNPSKSFKCKQSSLYYNYCKEIRHIFKQNMEQQVKRQHKMLKVREMIESIRQGRKKFNELIQIYEGRIVKLEEKIVKVKGQHLLQSEKSSRK